MGAFIGALYAEDANAFKLIQRSRNNSKVSAFEIKCISQSDEFPVVYLLLCILLEALLGDVCLGAGEKNV